MLRTFAGLMAFTSTVGGVAASACSSTSPETAEREAHVYAVVIQALAVDALDDLTPSRGQPEQVVFAGPLDDEPPIPLEVQAAVVDELEDFVTVRFVDSGSEAVDDSGEGRVILEDGLIVLLGAVPSGSSPRVAAERYVTPDRSDHFRVHTEESDGEWQLVSLEPT